MLSLHSAALIWRAFFKHKSCTIIRTRDWDLAWWHGFNSLYSIWYWHHLGECKLQFILAVVLGNIIWQFAASVTCTLNWYEFTANRSYYWSLARVHPKQVAGRPSPSRLRLIQDIKTRWNLTCFMLICFLRLRNAIEAYHSRSDMTPQLRLLHVKTNDLKLAEYLLVLTYSFALKGYTICAEAHPTIYLV